MNEVKYIVEYSAGHNLWVRSFICGDCDTAQQAEAEWKLLRSSKRYRIVELRTVRTVVKESE